MRAKTHHVFAGVTVLLLALVWLHGARTTRTPSDRPGPAGDIPAAWEAAARSIGPSGLSLRPASHGPCRLEGIDASGTVRWHAVFSAFLAPRPAGYAGPVDLVAGFDDAGRITGVRLLSHTETPTFVAGIDSDWFLGQFAGKTAHDPLVPGEDIEGLTHATVSVEALCQALRQGFAVANASSGRPLPREPASALPSRKGVRTSLVAVFIAVLAACFQRFIGNALAATFVVFSLGLLSPTFVSLSHLRFLTGGSASFQAGLILALAATAVFLSRRGYCRFLCPCGRLQDVIHSISPAASPGSCSPGPGRALLWTVLLLYPMTEDLPLERAEVFSALFFRNLGAWGTLLAVSVLAGAALVPRFYCRKLCPLNPLFADIETFKTSLARLRPAEKPGPGGDS
ncbi:MAG TPA: FMN-binding protein [Candidatus Ozemobacteraceae bacterium]|nr:FMN-binding protein [Candidatus Ozemobacteraceae bacterium]